MWDAVTITREHATTPQMSCNHCDHSFCGDATRIRQHICEKCTATDEAFLILKEKLLAETDEKEEAKKQKEAVREVNAASEEVKPAAKPMVKMRQQSIGASMAAATAYELDGMIAEFFYACNIAPNVVNHPTFKKMIMLRAARAQLGAQGLGQDPGGRGRHREDAARARSLLGAHSLGTYQAARSGRKESQQETWPLQGESYEVCWESSRDGLSSAPQGRSPRSCRFTGIRGPEVDGSQLRRRRRRRQRQRRRRKSRTTMARIRSRRSSSMRLAFGSRSSRRSRCARFAVYHDTCTASVPVPLPYSCTIPLYYR